MQPRDVSEFLAHLLDDQSVTQAPYRCEIADVTHFSCRSIVLFLHQNFFCAQDSGSTAASAEFGFNSPKFSQEPY